MKYLVVSCILFLYTLQTFGQQEYFVYLQTDNNQPFYVRINNRVYSSSLTGYLILSKLADSAHSVTIGFPKNVFPEQQFNIPVKHKDAGYLLKSFGDRGWGLFNLQSLSVIMNDNPPGEKKNPELTGTRKTDAFSMLLANAVNDTAVLYTATRPPKPAPVEVREEAKKDSALLAKTATPKDSSPTTRPVKNDSNIAGSNNPAAANDSLRVATTQPAAMKAQPARDTVLVSKNTSRPAAHPTGKNKPVKKEPPITARNDASAQRKTTIIVIGRRAREKAVAKDKNERKDTIIMMSGGPTEKSVAKNTRAAKKKSPAHDTLRIKKEIIFAPEEKRNALLNNRDAVVIENVPLKKETDTHHEPRKDTIELLTGKETAPETKRDTFTAAPAKRLRPLVNKAAELLTDTSYIAVFVDESNEKFDTIRISIPFNEQSMMVRREPKLAPADTAATVSNPSPPPVISQAPPVLEKDSVTAARDIKENTSPQNLPPTEKTDTGKVNNKTSDSSSKGPMAPAIVHAVPAKDSLPAHADSAEHTKSLLQPLYLNTDCKEVAFDSDIDKLRVKMLLVLSDEERIALAKKVFKQKCLLVKQVRALSELFKTDEGKYKWFDAAYAFVSDTGNFASLGEFIKDEYYLNRFKAMLRH